MPPTRLVSAPRAEWAPTPAPRFEREHAKVGGFTLDAATPSRFERWVRASSGRNHCSPDWIH